MRRETTWLKLSPSRFRDANALYASSVSVTVLTDISVLISTHLLKQRPPRPGQSAVNAFVETTQRWETSSLVARALAANRYVVTFAVSRGAARLSTDRRGAFRATKVPFPPSVAHDLRRYPS